MSPDTTFLYAWLDANDAACPRCRYCLRGIRSRHCPECGYELILDRRDQFDWWAAGVFGLLIIGCADLLMLLAVGIIGAAGAVGFLATFVVLGVALVVTVAMLMRQVRARAGSSPGSAAMKRRTMASLGVSGVLSLLGMLVLATNLVV